MRPLRTPRRRRPGLTPADVLVALAVAAVVILFVLMALPRTRETARLASCRRNLAQIGQAVLAYQGTAGSLPFVGVPSAADRPIEEAPPSPQQAMLDALGVADFLGVDVLKKEAPRSGGAAPAGGMVAGFLCPSDAAGFGRFPAPISYRANVGSDAAGTDGPFAPGRSIDVHEVERRDGVAFTAAFSERLLGDGRDEPSRVNYGLVPSLDEDPSDRDWRGDAGSTWLPADFRYTLYTHAQRPGAVASKVARDGRSSDVGAISAHVGGVNVLLLDGSARLVAPSINADVWRAMGSVGPEPTTDTAPRD
jgi:prepilin-type processing-associated H-X9-DG protein